MCRVAYIYVCIYIYIYIKRERERERNFLGLSSSLTWPFGATEIRHIKNDNFKYVMCATKIKPVYLVATFDLYIPVYGHSKLSVLLPSSYDFFCACLQGILNSMLCQLDKNKLTIT